VNNRKGFLLASFITTNDEQQIQEEVQFIADNLNLTAPYIFLMQNATDPSKKILTYNAETEKGKSFNPRLYTMRLHRKKQTNSLYTINALNLALALEHDGASGRHLKLDWEKYQNTMLLTAGKKLQTYPVEVLKIFKIEQPPEEN
jgi:hypothetical protein|tara:strand:+ start:141 stop:575 length:435 start_codon:yes stop_codon:yes gene_type:complete